MNTRDYDTTVARIAGNIAAGLVRLRDPIYQGDRMAPEAAADLAVDLARRIVARVRETEPGAVALPTPPPVPAPREPPRAGPPTEWLTVRDAAKILRVGPRTVYAHIRAKRLRVVQINAREYRIARHWLDAFTEATA